MKRNSIYAYELRIIRSLAQWADLHQNLVNAAIIAQAAYTLYYIFMYG